MEIASSLRILTPGAQPKESGSSLPFRVGQVFAATVIRTLPDTGQAQISIGGKQVIAQSARQLTPGQNLRLQVVESGPQAKLKILDSGGAPRPLREQTVLNHIAEQQSPTLLVKQLIGLSKSASGIDSLPQALRSLVQSLLNQTPDLSDLTTVAGIRQAIAESGIFLEAKLALLSQLDQQSLNRDFKANLLRLIASSDLENPPLNVAGRKDAALKSAMDPELSADWKQALGDSARAALGRIVLNQIASLPENQGDKQVWKIEIPVLDAEKAESVKVTIERDQRTAAEVKGHQWSIVIELNPPELGRLESKITWVKDQVNVFFRSETEATRDLLRSNLHLLKHQLHQAGLETGQLAAGAGIPHENPLNVAIHSLFDERV